MSPTMMEAEAARDAACAQAEARVRASAESSRVVAMVTLDLLALLDRTGRREFTADDVGAILDGRGVAADMDTRKRRVSVLIKRGAQDGRWLKVGYAPSARRKCAPVALWKLAPSVTA